MPVNPPRLSNGMEDPNAYFDSSPAAPDTGKTTQSRRTAGGGDGDATPAGTTPGSGRRGRMSQLDDGAEEGSIGGDDLVVDDEFPSTSSFIFEFEAELS